MSSCCRRGRLSAHSTSSPVIRSTSPWAPPRSSAIFSAPPESDQEDSCDQSDPTGCHREPGCQRRPCFFLNRLWPEIAGGRGSFQRKICRFRRCFRCGIGNDGRRRRRLFGFLSRLQSWRLTGLMPAMTALGAAYTAPAGGKFGRVNRVTRIARGAGENHA